MCSQRRQDRKSNHVWKRVRSRGRKGQQLIDPWCTHRLTAAALTCPSEPRLFLGNVRNVHTCQVFMSWTLTCKWTQSAWSVFRLKPAAPWTFFFYSFSCVQSITLAVHTHLCLLMKRNSLYRWNASFFFFWQNRSKEAKLCKLSRWLSQEP